MQNDTNSKVYEAHDGTNDVRSWMEIKEYDGMDNLNIWNTKYGLKWKIIYLQHKVAKVLLPLT